MVDEGRAARLLRGVAERVDRSAHASEHRNTDSESLWLDGVKYLFVTAIEGSVDLAHHIISSESWGSPDTNAGAVRLLGVHGVVSSEIAETPTITVDTSASRASYESDCSCSGTIVSFEVRVPVDARSF
jgi:uncharacterized protein YutE (UPF0331/DUF86 family)